MKRKKSDADLNAGTSVVKSSAQNGALVQAVCPWSPDAHPERFTKKKVSLVNHSSRFPAPVGSMLRLWNLQVWSGLL